MRRLGLNAFTLIECLVVAAAVGILASLAIPFYWEYQRGAVDSNMQTVLRNARQAMEAFYVETQTYASAEADLEKFGYTPTERVSLQVLDNGQAGYTLRACADGGTERAFRYDSDDGAVVPDDASCDG